MDTTFRTALTRTGAATGVAAVVGSIATIPGSRWFRTLDKPAWQPPDSAFGPVWTALYTDIAVVSAQHLADAARRGDDEEVRRYSTALGVNLVLNAGWCWTFFRAHRLAPSVAVAGALAASSADLARRVAPGHPERAAALAPYALWTGFATALTEAIRRRND